MASQEAVVVFRQQMQSSLGDEGLQSMHAVSEYSSVFCPLLHRWPVPPQSEALFAKLKQFSH